MHFASLWIKFGEHVPVEAIVVLHEAESRCAVWHGLELFLFYSLAFKIVVVDFVPFRGKKDACFKVFPRVAFFLEIVKNVLDLIGIITTVFSQSVKTFIYL